MRLAIYSNMEGTPWGASEELWSQAARRLLGQGHRVFLNYKRWPELPAPLAELKQMGADLHLRSRSEKVLRNLRRSLKRRGLFRSWLRRVRPDMVLISSAVHVGDVALAEDCRAAGVPYAILLHSLPPDTWYRDRYLPLYAAAFAGATRCFLVSRMLQELLEDRLARRLPQGCVVANPLDVQRDAPLPWPEDNGLWRLACVARCDPGVKGQDLILRVLGSPRWKQRPLRVSFWCVIDNHARHLMQLAKMHGVEQAVEFPGFADDVKDIWKTHHGLLLPSRHDGVPMSTVEALFCGRIAIVSRVGRNSEFVDDGETGFLLPAATESLLDHALQRAWQSRGRWQDMGRLAAQRMPQRFPRDPTGDFCRHLEDCLSVTSTGVGQPVLAKPPSGLARDAA